eukprot:gnl/TRDRNA2_/TRDRNA2_156901_c0_seq2.p1 gnl/TRDRNA2_/TRDRNA2_156901_c0~~gnl/TRDRNA2_/TRDRNA2_156901_c0_seq2.p1  ORF type:complete len:478 (+),score=45.16 gnl/TRDRNA2_/TRDRNA2_156901_c0_seq2:108-1541(+)
MASDAEDTDALLETKADVEETVGDSTHVDGTKGGEVISGSTMASSSSQAGDPAEDRWISSLQCCAALSMGLPPGCAIAFYCGLVGFYTENFHGGAFYSAMQACVTIPFLVILFLQHTFDAMFDEMFSTVLTYLFRCFAMQLVLACVILVYILVPQSPLVVLNFGVLIGSCSAVLTSSSTQMVAQMGPGKLVWLTIGSQVGAAVPALVFPLAHFEVSSPLSKFRLVVSTAIVVCICSCSFLVYLHARHSIFHHAFRRLSYDLPSAQRSLEESEHSEIRIERQLTPTQPPAPTPADGVPTWVWYWCAFRVPEKTMSFTILGLCPFFGSTSLAQTLMLLRMTMECIGRLVVIPVINSAGFKTGPYHRVLGSCICLRVSLFVVLLLYVVSSNSAASLKISEAKMLLAWCVFYAVDNFDAGLADVTTAEYVQVSSRKLMARANLVATFSGLCLGLLDAQLVSSFAMESGDRGWPSMTAVIRK